MRDDELLDLIDPEREVLEITPDTLFWNVPDTAPARGRKLSRTSFKNTVSKVEKKLSHPSSSHPSSWLSRHLDSFLKYKHVLRK
ncbi:hypothetical protein ALT1644_190045 [Alteromonas macleodii]